MFFRPNFCANCGEKVERTEWGPFTSRRFCVVCESEFKGHDLVPRAVVILAMLVGVLGVGAYMRSGDVSGNAVIPRQILRPQPQAMKPAEQPAAAVPSAPRSSETPATLAAPRALVSQEPAPAAVPKVEAEEVYICGAETKKGTPCSRRVKGNVRCYQHKGMPAMLPADKLKVG
jgi:hypothetical protein